MQSVCSIVFLALLACVFVAGLGLQWKLEDDVRKLRMQTSQTADRWKLVQLERQDQYAHQVEFFFATVQNEMFPSFRKHQFISEEQVERLFRNASIGLLVDIVKRINEDGRSLLDSHVSDMKKLASSYEQVAWAVAEAKVAEENQVKCKGLCR